jgi:hypothetical protein
MTGTETAIGIKPGGIEVCRKIGNDDIHDRHIDRKGKVDLAYTVVKRQKGTV